MARKLPATLDDLVIPEKIAQLVRYGHSPEAIAQRVIAPPLYMTEPPGPDCTVFLAGTDDPISSCSWKVAEEKYSNRDLYSVEVGEISKGRQTVWAWNQAMLAQITEARDAQVAANLVYYKDETCLGGFDRAIADALGSTRWRSTGDGKVLPYATGFGGRGIEYLTDQAGHVFLDAGVHGGQILVAQIAVERHGTGTGTRVMEAIRDYAVDHKLGIQVYKVTAKGYFARLDWLQTKDDGFTFGATAADLRSAMQHAVPRF